MEPPDLWEKALGERYAEHTPRLLHEHLGKKGKFFFTGHQVLKYGRSDRVPVSRLAVRPESLGVAVRLTIPEKPLRLRAPIDVLFESPRDTTRL